MDLQELKNTWQGQSVPSNLEEKIWKESVAFNKALEKENAQVSYLFGGTIFFLGVVVMSFIGGNSYIMQLIAALIFCMGIQAFFLWMRNSAVSKAMSEAPIVFIDKQITKLKYNLLVTNVISPIYVLLIGGISTLYTYEILDGFSPIVVHSILGGMWLFFVGIFWYGWRKQRKKDVETVIPMLRELEQARAEYKAENNS